MKEVHGLVEEKVKPGKLLKEVLNIKTMLK
jgi:hypothetical protein